MAPILLVLRKMTANVKPKTHAIIIVHHLLNMVISASNIKFVICANPNNNPEYTLANTIILLFFLSTHSVTTDRNINSSSIPTVIYKSTFTTIYPINPLPYSPACPPNIQSVEFPISKRVNISTGKP